MKFNFAVTFLFALIALTSPSHAGSLLEMSELGGKCIETDGRLICGEGEPALHIINGTQSPDKAEFAIGWRAPEREDWPFAELYLVRLSNGKVVQPLKAKVEWASQTQLANHQSVFASWMGNESGSGGGFVVGINGKWDAQSLEMYQWAGDGVLPLKAKFCQRLVKGFTTSFSKITQTLI